MFNIECAPWFIAKDVCEALGMSDVSTALQRLDDDEKGASKVCTLGGPQNLRIVSESGMYALTMRSNKPQAKRFRKWVTSVVLPAIRKDGAYINCQPNYTPTGHSRVDTLRGKGLSD